MVSSLGYPIYERKFTMVNPFHYQTPPQKRWWIKGIKNHLWDHTIGVFKVMGNGINHLLTGWLHDHLYDQLLTGPKMVEPQNREILLNLFDPLCRESENLKKESFWQCCKPRPRSPGTKWPQGKVRAKTSHGGVSVWPLMKNWCSYSQIGWIRLQNIEESLLVHYCWNNIEHCWINSSSYFGYLGFE